MGRGYIRTNAFDRAFVVDCIQELRTTPKQKLEPKKSGGYGAGFGFPSSWHDWTGDTDVHMIVFDRAGVAEVGHRKKRETKGWKAKHPARVLCRNLI